MTQARPVERAIGTPRRAPCLGCLPGEQGSRAPSDGRGGWKPSWLTGAFGKLGVMLSVLLMAVGACAPVTAPGTPTAGAQNAQEARPMAPRTEIRSARDTYHGVTVQDDYRWLEGTGPDVSAWTDRQNAYSRQVLGNLPGRAPVAKRITAVMRAPYTRFLDLRIAGGRFFVQVEQPPRQQPFLIVMPEFGDPARASVLLDPNDLDPSGKTSIDWYRPSADGRRVAVSLSRAGTESGDLHVIAVDGGVPEETIPRVNGGTAGGDVAWTVDGKGFFYTRYPAPDERPAEDLGFYQQLYFHQLGTPHGEDRCELCDGLPRIAEVRVEVDPRSGRVLATVQLGDGGKFSHFLRATDGSWRRVTGFEDGVVQVVFGPERDLFAISRRDAPRGVMLRLNGETLALDRAAVLHAPQDETLVSGMWEPRTMLFRPDRWYATFQLGGPSTVRAFDYAGNPLPLELPFEVASVSRLMSAGEGRVVLRAESFVDPAAWFVYDERKRAIERTALSDTAPIDMARYRVVRETATSADGTPVPLNILLPPDVELDGEHPCVVTGYGGYGISLEPRFSTFHGLWLERGVIYVVANLRGGGEFGRAWHHAGNLVNKQNVFDDFTAVLKHLIARRYTRPERLGIIGGSNGGLLMGATLTQHPELMRSVVSYVGIYDMLRVELSPNGAFNVTEFGTVQDPAQFAALHAYSPYHHVREGVAYPATLMLTGDNDPRVDPMHSRKMTARLQAATTGPLPILLRTSRDAGHGRNTDLDERIAETTDVMTFMLDALESLTSDVAYR